LVALRVSRKAAPAVEQHRLRSERRLRRSYRPVTGATAGGSLPEKAAPRQRVGCDKRLETCRDRFANVVNFRRFPHIAGQDTVIRYPNRGDAHSGDVL
jgi:uncharacterized phage protein (TIGR02218 family)